jgi:hypothetical protein
MSVHPKSPATNLRLKQPPSSSVERRAIHPSVGAAISSGDELNLDVILHLLANKNVVKA